MKILLVNKYWYPRGGAERAVLLTKKILETAGHTVEIFGMKHEKNEQNPPHFIDTISYDRGSFVSRLIAGVKSVYNRDAKKKFCRLIESFGPDIVHFHNIYHQLSFSLFDVVRRKNIPSVFSLHDYKILSPNYRLFNKKGLDRSSLGGAYYWCFLKNTLGSLGASFFAMIEAYVRRWKKWSAVVDCYIAPSVFMKSICESTTIPMRQIEVIPNPLEVSKKTPSVGNFVTYVGRLTKEKGVETLLAAAKKTPNITYHIIGDGPEKPSLLAYSKNHAITNVHFFGWLSGEKLSTAIDRARFVVIPSVWYENNPYSILETLAKGKVVIGSAIGGIPELLPKKCLFIPGDVEDLVRCITLWYTAPLSILVSQGRMLQKSILEKTDWHRYGQCLEKVYRSVRLKNI